MPKSWGPRPHHRPWSCGENHMSKHRESSRPEDLLVLIGTNVGPNGARFWDSALDRKSGILLMACRRGPVGGGLRAGACGRGWRAVPAGRAGGWSK
jgi:hypothetical protein